MPPSSATGSPRNPAIIHGSLVAGGLLLLGVAGYLLYGVSGPLLAGGTLVGYLLAAPALTAVLLGATVLRSRVPPRMAGQSDAEYWAAPNRLGQALVLWAAMEQAVVLALVGWLLSGTLAALGVGLLALAALVLNGPGALGSR